MMVNEALIAALDEWNFHELLSDGEPQEQMIETELPEETTETVLVGGIDNEKLKQNADLHRRFTEYVELLFSRFITNSEINTGEISDRIRELCEAVKEDRRFLLHISDQGSPNRNFLTSHTVRSTIIAIVIGTYLRLPNHRLIELGTAALLHEIGMIKLPPQLYMTNKPLSPQERQLIGTHPVLGYNILKAMDFPVSICVAALEHHERENGGGYPRHLSSDKISIYAKIIAVACSYEALTAARPYKDAKDGYQGMIDLLKNVGKQYDDTIVRALVYSLSLYPIGLHVLLSNSKKAQVIDVNPENPRFPIVQVTQEKTPEGKALVIQTKQDGVYIVRPLLKTELGK